MQPAKTRNAAALLPRSWHNPRPAGGSSQRKPAFQAGWHRNESPRFLHRHPILAAWQADWQQSPRLDSCRGTGENAISREIQRNCQIFVKKCKILSFFDKKISSFVEKYTFSTHYRCRIYSQLTQSQSIPYRHEMTRTIMSRGKQRKPNKQKNGLHALRTAFAIPAIDTLFSIFSQIVHF